MCSLYHYCEPWIVFPRFAGRWTTAISTCEQPYSRTSWRAYTYKHSTNLIAVRVSATRFAVTVIRVSRGCSTVWTLRLQPRFRLAVKLLSSNDPAYWTPSDRHQYLHPVRVVWCQCFLRAESTERQYAVTLPQLHRMRTLNPVLLQSAFPNRGLGIWCISQPDAVQ